MKRRLKLRIFHLFFRFGRVQSVKILSGGGAKHPNNNADSPSATSNGGPQTCAGVAFMDITSACKAHAVEHSMDDRVLRTNFYDPNARDSPAITATDNGTNNASSTSSSSSTNATSSQSSSSAVASRLHGGDLDHYDGGRHSSHAYSSSPSSSSYQRGGSGSGGPQEAVYSSSSRRSSYRSSFQSSDRSVPES